MASDDTLPITFSIPGLSGPIAVSAAATASRGSDGRGSDGSGSELTAVAMSGLVKVSVRVGVQRDGGAPVRASAVPGEDIVVLHIENGPVLYLHPATARDLLRGAQPAGTARGGVASDDVAVALELQWPGAGVGTGVGAGVGLGSAEAAATPVTRDLADIGRVLVSGFQILASPFKGQVADFAASLVVNKVDSQVDAGVYALRPDRLDKLKDSGRKLAQVPAATEPMLVLLHGTFVETVSTFGKLWLGHGSGVAQLFERYGQRVYALDHPTLGASPIANARTLVDALPNGARLHLVTHSRGGLVAEVLARLAGTQGVLTDADRAFFGDATYAGQLRELSELAAQVKLKNVHVERVVRVACPARGTLLASRRLDAYMSVLKWTLEAAGLPLLPGLVDFIGEVARRRADPSEIPGLAAMMPGSPLVNWLNSALQPTPGNAGTVGIPGDLRVVAGDLQHGSTIGSWLKALLADAYYWTDNDIVVNTNSMYGGAPRAGGATFLLDQGSGVTHFSYFENDKTANAVVRALIESLPPAGFQAIGPLSWAGTDASGERGLFDEATASPADPRKPAVFVLPGILGSNLKQGDPQVAGAAARIWLSPRLIGGFDRLAYQPGGADSVQEDGPIGAVYSDLTAYLATSHEVIPFGYDWRRPLQEEAVRLATRIKVALDARAGTKQPVRILAHSMGGLLARTLQLVDPATWNRLMAHADARFVMLGTPNGGSWAPMQVLSGDDTFGNALAAIGSPFANSKARSLMAQMPGFLQLQADLLDDNQRLALAGTWQQLADDDVKREADKNWWHRYAGEAMGLVYTWGVPPQAVLKQAQDLRTQLDAQVGTAIKACVDKVLLVVGQAAATPVGFEVGADGFTYLESADGDGRVPLASALLPGVRTWQLNCEHGSLPSAQQAFDAYADLLSQGTTSRLPTLAASLVANLTRGGPANVAGSAPVVLRRNRPSRRPASALPAGAQSTVFNRVGADDAGASTASTARSGRSALPPVQVTVLNGNLTFVKQALMVGHYRSLSLTGTEAVVDRHLGGVMAQSLRAGLYPTDTGTQRTFFNRQVDPDNPWQAPRPAAAIVVGLGEEGDLTAACLQVTVSQGVKAWSQRAHEAGHGPDSLIELAATLIGSGGLGVSPGSAARAIARGVWLANQRLAGTGWPLITRLVIVEWYLDRAAEAWRGLRLLAEANPKAYVIDERITSGVGPLRRQPDSGYRGANYDLISITGAAEGCIAFELDTRRARSEVRAQHTQPALVRKLVERAATARSSDPRLGHTLFQLLVPLELKPFLSGTDRAVLKLDDRTAPIPWELLDTDPSDGSNQIAGALRPWSIRTKLLRTLSTENFRNNPLDANAEDAVLIIGAPNTEGTAYPPLEGAKREALAVAQLLGGPAGVAPGLLQALVNDAEFDVVIGALMARPYRIVHVAGHGAPKQIDPQTGALVSKGGVVLSQGVFLGPDEIQKLETVPELVFVNCCHLGGHDAKQVLSLTQPVAFAAGMADELIQMGVRCVVAAGWAVDDDAAEIFATTFYGALLAGRPFIDAVGQAREATWLRVPGSKTWAAYQCYGDPNWTFRRGTADAQAARPAAPRNGTAGVADGIAEGIASAAGLALVLEDLAIRTHYATGDVAAQQTQARSQLRELQEHHGDAWGGMGAVAEAFGVAWEAAQDRDAAIDCYTRALRANDASASVRAHEQLGRLLVERAWANAQTPALTTAAGTTDAGPMREELVNALRELQTLVALQPTLERLSLMALAWQRQAQLQARGGMDTESAASLAMALEAYGRAEAEAAASNSARLFETGLLRMATELVHRAGDKTWRGLDAATTARTRRSLQALHDSEPDFQTHASGIQLDLFEALTAGQLAQRQPALSAVYAALLAQVPATQRWAQVLDAVGWVLETPRLLITAAQRAAAAKLLVQLRGYAQPASA